MIETYFHYILSIDMTDDCFQLFIYGLELVYQHPLKSIAIIVQQVLS